MTYQDAARLSTHSPIKAERVNPAGEKDHRSRQQSQREPFSLCCDSYKKTKKHSFPTSSESPVSSMKVLWLRVKLSFK